MGNANLQKAQKKLLGQLNRIDEFRTLGFYLAGGSGLNLHLQHRLSIDHDFFTPTEFAPLELLSLLREHFDISDPQTSRGTLHCSVENIKCSFFHYPYPAIEQASDFAFPTASLLDIAAMKLAAIAGRGAKKDFFDLYFILKSQISFDEIWQAYERKFSLSKEDLYPVLKSLTYFDDAESETLGRDDEEKIWREMKSFFTALSKKTFSHYFSKS